MTPKPKPPLPVAGRNLTLPGTACEAATYAPRTGAMPTVAHGVTPPVVPSQMHLTLPATATLMNALPVAVLTASSGSWHTPMRPVLVAATPAEIGASWTAAGTRPTALTCCTTDHCGYATAPPVARKALARM